MQENTTYIAGLYLRLSKDDEQAGESVSIGTQRSILMDFCEKQGFDVYKIYIDDGYSGMNFERPGFKQLLEDVERGLVNMVITKDLSRLGRDYIMTGYYSEIFFQTKGIRYIALADDFDSLKGNNEIAPFKNILNDMYARDISKKVKNAKHQRAKQGLFIASQTPYGYQRSVDSRKCLIVDPGAAAVVRMIFSYAEKGLGNIAIAAELKEQKIVAPSVYKYQHGDKRFENYPAIKNGNFYAWCPGTIGQILNNRVYLGELASLKTEVINCKTKQRIRVPADKQMITVNAHEAIISQEQFDRVKEVRKNHRCPSRYTRENIFRGKLYCECCGHPLAISRKQLLYRDADIYLCMYHYKHPEICPKTHIIYHEVLYPYVLQQIQSFAKSMKRRKINSPIKDYAAIDALTPEIIDDVIERIEIGHLTRKSKPGSVIRIYWKLK